jgi:hypothetical protein
MIAAGHVTTGRCHRARTGATPVGDPTPLDRGWFASLAMTSARAERD